MALFTLISAAITAISSWTIGLGALGTFAVGNFLLRAAVQLGVSALAKAFAGGNDGPAADPFSIQGSIRTGGAVPRSFVFGPSLTAGSLVWHSEWGAAGGTPNAYYTQVIALSDLPVAGLNRVFINGAAVVLDTVAGEKGFAALEYREDGVDHAWVKFYDGTQIVADPYLAGTVNDGAPRTYTSDRIGTGIAYAIVTFRINQEMFTGFPACKFVLDGVKLYDITKDTSEGGTGAHRWNDPATWGGDGDELPGVQAYNLARGMYYGGNWIYGLQGLTSARLPAAHWITQIDKCRAQVTGESGLESIYRCAGEITINSEIGAAFEAILTACAGRMSEVGGVFKLYVGAPDAAIAHIEDDEILSLAPQTFTPFFGLSNTVNGVTASYPAPDEGYVMRSTPPLYNAAYEAEDGGRRLLTNISLSFVPFPVQAQRLLQGELAAARRARRHTFSLPAKFRLIEPGDTVTWTSPRNGYTAKLFRVDGIIDLPNCDLIIDMTEVDASDHGSFDYATDYDPAVTSPLITVQPTAQGVIGFNPVASDIQDGAGTARRAGLLMQWTSVVDDIDGIRFEIRVAATGLVVSDPQTRRFSRGDMLIEAGLVPATAYEVRAKYIPATRRRVSWTSWVPVSTNDVRLINADLGPASITWTELGQGVKDQIDSAGDANASAAAALASAALADADRIAAETAKTAAEGSATASAGSASAADAHKTAAGVSASAAEVSKLAADTASAAAAISETNAAGSATSADSSKSAAESAKVLAVSAQGGAESAKVAAETAETNAAIAEGNADDAAAGAVLARDVAAKVYSGQAYDNPIFARWSGTYPDGVTNVSANDGSSVTKSTGGVYGNAIDLYSGTALTANRPNIQFRATSGEVQLPDAEDCGGLYLEIELEKLSGAGWGGAYAVANWVAGGTGGTNASVRFYFKDYMAGGAGRQVLAADAIRPAAYVPGDAAGYVKLQIFGTSDDGGYTRNTNTTRIHRVNMRALNTAASAMIQQQAITDLEGNAAAMLIMRAKAGTSDGSVEITAASDPEGGAASKVKMTGDVIEFDGMSVFNDTLQSGNFSAGSDGWQFKQDGSAEFANLVVRSWMQDGAVSDGAEYYSAQERNKADGTTLGKTSIGTMATNQFWHVAVTCDVRLAHTVSHTTGDGTEKDPYVTTYTYTGTSFKLEWRTKDTSGSAFSDWSTLYTSGNNISGTWVTYSDILQLMGNFFDVEFRFKFASHATPDQNNVREASIIAKSVVK